MNEKSQKTKTREESSVINTYKTLVEEAKKANDAYYDNDDPIMSDEEYDVLMRQIKEIETKYPELISKNSPTQYVGGTASKNTLAKVKHEVPMLSLKDVFAKHEVYEFLGKFDDDTQYCVEEKIDGLSLSVTYVNGVLVNAKTRGDGVTFGEDVTESAKFINGIPHKLKALKNGAENNIKLLEVRCEVYLPIEAFMILNAEKEQKEEKLFANPRNAAAGLLRTKKVSDIKNAGLCAFAFNVQRFELSGDVKSSWCPSVSAFGVHHSLELNALKDLGFNVVTSYHCDSEGVLNMIDKIGNNRANLPYWIDGAVVKLNSIEERNKVGSTSKVPLWAIAWKYPAEEKETTIRNIILQTGRTGRVTPVAIFDPVYLAGTKVEKATLHNPEMIEVLNVNVGDVVQVKKSGEIIPKITKLLQKGSVGYYNVFEHTCPSCGGKLIHGADENGDNISGAYCVNPNCPAQISRKFEFWASRDCMDIRGFGPAQIDKFIENGWLKTIPDIYRLKEHKEEMLKLDGFGEKAVNNLLEAIETSKDRDIDRLIKALGIPGIGKHIGKNLAKKCKSIFAVGVFDIKELSEIDGVGEISAQAIHDAFYYKTKKSEEITERYKKSDMLILLEELKTLGVNVISKSYVDEEKNVSETSSFSGKTFVITGTLPTMKREEAAALIEANGGKVSGSVSKKTDYLLCGENAGSKLEKAETLGVKIIGEEDLKKMLDEI